MATAHPLLQENSRETSTEKRKKREEKEGAHHRKKSPTPLPRELERDARGLEKQSRQGSDPGSCLLFTDTEPLVELF